MAQYVCRFVRLLCAAWKALMAGAVAIAVGFISAAFNWPIPPSAFWTISAVSIGLALFLVWLQECKAREAAEHDLAVLREEHKKKAAISCRLAELYEEGKRVRKRIANSDDETSVKHWNQEMSLWMIDLKGYVEQEVSPAKAAYLQAPSAHDMAPVEMRSTETRRGKEDLIRTMSGVLERLHEILRDY